MDNNKKCLDNIKRQWSSSQPSANNSNSSSSSMGGKPESSTKDPPTLKNLTLATALFGFVTYVFWYSLNAVGRADGDEDPLAQLKAEANEAMQYQTVKKKLTPEEIQALESGTITTSGGDDDGGEQFLVEVTGVAVPIDISTIEEEANLNQNGIVEKKLQKPWWRFGF
jgi:hypothetical protein